MDAPLFLGYATAAYVLLHRGLAGLRKSHALPAPGTAPTAKQVAEARELFGLPTDARLDTVVTCDRDKRVDGGQRPHVSGNATIGDYLHAGNSIYISKPELAFLQAAQTLSCQELVLLGLELCGSFVSEDGLFARNKPLSSVAALAHYVELHEGKRGAKKAREALRYVVDGSASPRESQLVALLCMPRKWGGYGLNLPVLNGKIDLTPQQRKILGKSHLRCDLFWGDAGLAVEYDSDGFHTGAEKINADSLRRNILRATGITVVDVTNTQIKKAEAFHEVAILVDHHLGSNAISKRRGDWNARNAELRNLVLLQNASDRLL